MCVRLCLDVCLCVYVKPQCSGNASLLKVTFLDSGGPVLAGWGGDAPHASWGFWEVRKESFPFTSHPNITVGARTSRNSGSVAVPTVFIEAAVLKVLTWFRSGQQGAASPLGHFLPLSTTLSQETTGAVGPAGVSVHLQVSGVVLPPEPGPSVSPSLDRKQNCSRFCSHVVLGSRRPPRTKENTSKTKTLSVKVPKRSTHAGVPRTERLRDVPASCLSAVEPDAFLLTNNPNHRRVCLLLLSGGIGWCVCVCARMCVRVRVCVRSSAVTLSQQPSGIRDSVAALDGCLGPSLRAPQGPPRPV